MRRVKTKLDTFDYIEMDADTSEDGSRVYHTPWGPAPSVTTILSTLPNPGIDAWRERVGEEEADRVSKEATTIGSYMHDMLEAKLKGEEFSRDGSDLEKIASQMVHAMRMINWRFLEEVWGIEVPLHYETLYAGRTDLVGVYKGKVSIIDYKTAKWFKDASHLTNYKLQMAAYSIAHEWMHPGVEFEQGVLMFATRPNPEYNLKAQADVVVIDKSELLHYQEMWVDVLHTFHS